MKKEREGEYKRKKTDRNRGWLFFEILREKREKRDTQ